MVYKSEIAIFDGAGGTCVGCVLLKEVVTGSVKAVEVAGKQHCFQIETVDEILHFQLASADMIEVHQSITCNHA